MNRRRGQVIVMVTLALFAMCGMMGLAVDLGWAYFVEKSAQAAADAAALAAVSKALDTVGESEAYSTLPTASPAVRCASIDPGSVLGVGCQFAQRNGFTDSESGRQRVWMAAGVDTVPPTVPKVGTMQYWVTATVAERIPQLFSAVLGNRMGGASARATAGFIQVPATGQLYALDRQFDVGTPSGKMGNDMFLAGGGRIITGGDVILASTAGGRLPPPPYPYDPGNVYYAGEGSGGWEVWTESGSTFIRGDGWVTAPDNFYSGTPPVRTRPENGLRDDGTFLDPMRGRGQPLPPRGLSNCPVLNGLIDSKLSATWAPGNYYAVDAKGQATGGPLEVSAGVRFGDGSSGPNCWNGASKLTGFGNYVFFGGMVLPGGRVDFDPGRYVFAGVKEARKGTPGLLIDSRTQMYLSDNTPLVGTQSQPNSDAGEIFIFTDTNYYALNDRGERQFLQVPGALIETGVASQLKFGVVDLHAGSAAAKTEVNLHGLYWKSESGKVPPELKKFDGVVFWQDQRNSTVQYTDHGYIDCGQLDPTTQRGCVDPYSVDKPKSTSITNISPEMNLQATPSTHLYGIVYQPRGAWMVLHGGNDQMVSPMTLITGAIEVRGGPTVRLLTMDRPLRRMQVGLVE